MNDNNIESLIPREKFKGVFSTVKVQHLGFGDTRRKTRINVYIYVEEEESGEYTAQSLGESMLPVGDSWTMTREELLEDYLPEPDLYQNRVGPQLRELTKTIAKAERHRRQGDSYSAEYEFNNALKLDEHNVRATFGLGLTYLERGDTERGEQVFRRLSALKCSLQGCHKHLFNEFGIQLRKNGMFKQALCYYTTAYRVSREDEHLLYNMARTLYEMGNFRAAKRMLGRALSINPNLEEAREFLGYLNKRERRKQAKAENETQDSGAAAASD